MNRRGPLALHAVLVAAAIGPVSGAAAQLPEGGWRLVPPDRLVATGRLTDRRLAEASGAAPSAANPGLIWTMGDSGNPPELYAIDSTGALQATVRLPVPNVDWEEIALGPCGGASCLYVGDIGDNTERRTEIAIHRLREPTVVPGEATVAPGQVETLRVTYPDRPHDAEGMGVLPDGTVLIVTKGRRGGVLAFTIPPTAWGNRGLMTATRSDSLPIVPQPGTGRVVTGLAISPDGHRVVVRTYRELYLFERDDDGHLTPAGWTSCDILGKEPQGEAVGWLGDDWRVVLLSERGFFAAGTVLIGQCKPR